MPHLTVWVPNCALLEITTPSAVVRLLLHIAAEIEGFEPDWT